MKMKQIFLASDRILKEIAQPVKKIDENVKKILKEMKETLLGTYNPKGVGLAAPQIGYPLQIFAMKPKENSKVTFYINPKIIETGQEISTKKPPAKRPLEGCLSIPNTWGFVKRKQLVTLEYQNLDGKRKIKTFKGFPAMIVQHEMDHLQGILFTQRVLEQGQKLYEIVKDKEGKERLKELPL